MLIQQARASLRVWKVVRPRWGPFCRFVSTAPSRILWSKLPSSIPFQSDFSEACRVKLEGMLGEFKDLKEEISRNAGDPEKYTAVQKFETLGDAIQMCVHAAVSLESVEADRAKLSPSDPDFADWSLLLDEAGQEELEKMERGEEGIRRAVDEFMDRDLMERGEEFEGVHLEVRAGVGGKEGSLWAAEVYEAYEKVCDRRGWSLKEIGRTESDYGHNEGIKEVVARVTGHKCESFLRLEAGVHRVQRVPITDTAGRMQTSACSVAVLPLRKLEKRNPEKLFSPSEIKIEVTKKSSGHGGQSVNASHQAARVTHVATGLSVLCNDSQSLLENKMAAMQLLRAQVDEIKMKKVLGQEKAARSAAIGNSDRSEKIRTYNFERNVITDHRIEGEERHFKNLRGVLEGTDAEGEGLFQVMRRLKEQEERKDRETFILERLKLL